MPFTAQEISDAGKAALDFFLKNKPVDQIAVERPWIMRLRETMKSFPGGKQYVVEQLRKAYQSNFQWYYGSEQVSYNNRKTLDQAQYPWRSCHDGYYIDEDELLQNGIIAKDDVKPHSASRAEAVQLTNLFEENNEALALGFNEKFDFELLRDGAHDTDSVAGLDLLVKSDGLGTVGGINAAGAGNGFWKNNFVTGLSSTTILANMETQWRKCRRNGGRPNFIMAGQTFIDTYTTALRAAGTYQLAIMGNPKADGAIPTEGLHFSGVPITWNPVFEDIDAALSPAIPFEKRAYFLNMRHIKLRPADGHDMVKRNPPREHDRYVWYFAITGKYSLTTNRRNAHAFLSIT